MKNALIQVVLALAVIVLFFSATSSSAQKQIDFYPSPTPTEIETPTPTPIPATPKPVNKPKPTPVSNYLINGGQILWLINGYRASKGIPELTKSDELCRLAKKRTDFLIANNEAAGKASSPGHHVGFDSLLDEYRGAIGENIAGNVPSEMQTVEGWKHSPSHNEMLLKTQIHDNLVRFGCVASTTDGTNIITVFLIGDK